MNLKAKGGAEKWQSVKSVKMTGRMTAQGNEMPLTVYAMRPNYNRQEITMPAGKAIQAFDGTTAWVVNPMLGISTPQAVPGPAAEFAKHSADFDGALINYKEKGNTIELVGKENVIAGSDCGFGTFVGVALVEPEIAWAKLAALAEGARLASAELY